MLAFILWKLDCLDTKIWAYDITQFILHAGSITPVNKTEINGRGNPLRWPRNTLYPQKVSTNFADKWRSLSRYSSLVD
jgi:hypothetical protein